MKKYVKAAYVGYNISWYDQRGHQCGDYIEVPDNVPDVYMYIERVMQEKYGDEFGGLADYIADDIDAATSSGRQAVMSTMSEEELDRAILEGRPFDAESFDKWKVAPYRAEDAVQAKDINIGDFVQVTEDASEVDPGTILEIVNIDYDDPDGYNFKDISDDKVITFICRDRRGRKLGYNVHFWPDEYVGSIIGHQAKLDPNDFVKSATDIAGKQWEITWSKPWRSFDSHQDAWHTLYINGKQVGYVYDWQRDGDYGYSVYVGSDDGDERPQLVGEYKELQKAKDRLELEFNRAKGLIDKFSVESATNTAEISMKWGKMWRPYSGSPSAFTTLYVDGQEVGYVESWESDGAYGYTAYLKSDPTEYEESLGEFKSLDAAKARLEAVVRTTQDLVDKFPINSSETINRYSDARPYEDRKYWYFTTHGVGPGTVPKDLNVLEVREGQNEKGTWGDFICLDGVLNTDELDYYDLRELSPSDVTSDTEIDDDDDEWSPYQGHNYLVSGGPYSDITFLCDDPKSAITHWYKYQKKYPMDVSISCPTKELAMKLVKSGTAKLLTELNDRFGCPYNLDYMIEECKKKIADNCKGFYEDKYGYGDSVHPFSVG